MGSPHAALTTQPLASPPQRTALDRPACRSCRNRSAIAHLTGAARFTWLFSGKALRRGCRNRLGLGPLR
jgi:hypothetical protein